MTMEEMQELMRRHGIGQAEEDDDEDIDDYRFQYEDDSEETSSTEEDDDDDDDEEDEDEDEELEEFEFDDLALIDQEEFEDEGELTTASDHHDESSPYAVVGAAPEQGSVRPGKVQLDPQTTALAELGRVLFALRLLDSVPGVPSKSM